MSASGTAGVKSAEFSTETNSPSNISAIADGLQQSGMNCGDGIKIVAQLFAQIGLLVLPQGQPGPPGWTNLGPAGKYSGWYKGNPQQWQDAFNSIQPKLAAACSPAQGKTPIGVTLFVDCNFSGKSQFVGVGEYPVIDKVGIPNDTLSSLIINPGTTVILYTDYNFGGASLMLTAGGDKPLQISCLIDMKPKSWNDQVSSLKVIAQIR
jgi:hypothetical protein